MLGKDIMSSTPIAIPTQVRYIEPMSSRNYHYEIDSVTCKGIHNDNLVQELSVKHHRFDPNNNTPPNPWLKKLSERIDRYDNKTLST